MNHRKVAIISLVNSLFFDYKTKNQKKKNNKLKEHNNNYKIKQKKNQILIYFPFFFFNFYFFKFKILETQSKLLSSVVTKKIDFKIFENPQRTGNSLKEKKI